MSEQKLERFLASLYVDATLRARFLDAPREEAARAGLNAEQCDALAAIDRVGLKMAADSFERKRQKNHKS